MREKLELKILTLVIVLLMVGVVAAGVMVLFIEKSSLYEITEISSESTADIIARDIARIMIEGRADLAKQMLHDLKGVSGVEEISLLSHHGRPAFEPDAVPRDKAALERIAQTKSPFTVRDVKKITFFKPLENGQQCMGCHASDPPVLGAVKITISIAKEYRKATMLITIVILCTVLASICFSVFLWYMIRRMVIMPIKQLEQAASKLSEGDLSFRLKLKEADEIGRFGKAVRESLLSVSHILQRIKEVTGRLNRVAEEVEVESRKVADGAVLETESVNNISASIEEMNAVITDIADGTTGLAVSAEATASSMEQMVASISDITRNTQELFTAVESTSASIEELSATIREVAANTSDLASSAEETQSSIIQIASSVKEVEHNAKESAQLSDKVKNDAITLGMTSIEKTIKGMQNIKSSVEKTADYITKLGNRSEEIGKILNVIDEITDQTTMLALNAAILAAQAGEHGKGFSVVADEIKELADRTSMSTQEIAALIQSVQQEVGDAVSAMNEGLKSVEMGFGVTNEAADALRKIVESSKRSSEMAASIEHATTEQAKAANHVSSAMEKVLAMVGQIAKATNEQNRGIQLIMQATEKVRDVSNQVKTATNEQSSNTKHISQAAELVSDKSQQISRAINEQKIGSDQILRSVEKIKGLPKENRERAFKLNRLVKELMKDAELTSAEMEKFTFPDDTEFGILRMGIVPLESPAAMYKRFGPLAEHLAKTLSKRIDLKVAVDFQGAVNDLGRGVTQLCFMTPSTYIEANKKYGARVLVKALREGKPFQHSVIVARADSGINTIDDLRGRSFAFGDPHSTSSHIVPRGMLLSAGIDVKDLLYFNYLGHHDDVARAVLSGDFDAGGIMESTAQKFKDQGLKPIQFSEEIPEFNICVTKDLNADYSDAVRKALLMLKDSDPQAAPVLKSMDKSYTGFVEAEDHDYDSVRKMMIGIGLL